MSYTREEYLNRVLEGYASSFDITRPEEGTVSEEIPLSAVARMHVTETSYVITKTAEMWSASSHEYAYFFLVPCLDDATAEKCIEYAYNDGMSLIDDAYLKNHKCTRIAANFICDSVTPEAVKRVKKCRYYKNFQFSIKGWMEFHAVIVDLGKEEVLSNRYGRETAKYLKTVLKPAPRSKNRRTRGILGMWNR